MSTDTVDAATEPTTTVDDSVVLDEPDTETDTEQEQPVDEAAQAPAADGASGAEVPPVEPVFPAAGILTTLGNTVAIVATAAWQGIGGLGLLLISAVGALVSALLWGTWRRRASKAKAANTRAGGKGAGKKHAQGRSGAASGGRGRRAAAAYKAARAAGMSRRQAAKQAGKAAAGTGGKGRGSGLLDRLRGKNKPTSGKNKPAAGKGDTSAGKGRGLLDRLRGKNKSASGKAGGSTSGKSAGKGRGLLDRLRGKKAKDTSGKSAGKGRGLLDRLRGKKAKDTSGEGATGRKKKGDGKKGDKPTDKPNDGKPVDGTATPEVVEKPPGDQADSGLNQAPAKARPVVPVPSTTASHIYSGGSAMTFPLAATASEFRSAATQYHPKDMFEYAEHIQQLPDVMLDLAEGFKAMTARAQGQLALEHNVVQALADVYHALRNCIPVAADVAPVLRVRHEKDLARRENPRNGLEAEAGWNVQ